MPRQRVQGRVLRDQPFGIGNEPLDDFIARQRRFVGTENQPVNIGQKIRGFIGGAPDHHPVDFFEMGLCVSQRFNAAINDNREVRKLLFQPVNQRIIERGNFAVFLRAQPLQPGFAGMNDKYLDPCLGSLNQLRQGGFRVLVVHPDAAFHGDGYFHGLAHGRHARGHQIGLAHQAGPKRARLHTVGRAPDIEVYFVIPPVLADFGGFGQCVGSLPPNCKASGCSAASKSNRRARSPKRMASAVTISVYRRVCRVMRRRKNRSCRSVQSIIGATQN